MVWKLILILIAIPLVEIAILVQIWKATSLLFTVALLLAAGAVGLVPARVQGWLVWQKIMVDLRQGKMPADSLIEAMLVLLAGLLFIAPGLLTDVAGLLLLIPPSRRFVRERIKRRVRALIADGRARFVVRRTPPGPNDIERSP